jgi:hypothetical protein
MGVVSCGTTMLDQGVFENIGAVTWDTTVKTSGFTAVSGNGYFCNTTSAAFTVILPASPSAGDIVGIKDYANTADTNNITIGRNGSNIQGTASDFKITIEGGSVLLVYIDGTKGWLVTSASQASDITSPQFVTATGGTITESGDFKIHTFTGPGTFCVSCAGNPSGSVSVDYMVVAGGGGGYGGEGAADPSAVTGAGAGAGGFRESSGAASGCYTASPLGSGVSALPVSATGYPITVGGGGTAGTAPSRTGSQGSNSIFSSITSTGGGGSAGATGGNGGSGGGVMGRCSPGTAGTGNTPPVSPPQGNPGADNSGSNSAPYGGSGGGGATAAGGVNGPGGAAGTGGAGATTSISASPTAYAGGGGGGDGFPGTTSGAGGTGGGGGGSSPYNGTTNTGGGGGGGPATPGAAGAGGSGVVIIRYKFQ